MKDGRPSLTAATVSLVSALKWYTGDCNAILQAEVLRNLPRQDMPLPLWLLLRLLLSHEFFSNFFLKFWQVVLGKTEAFEGVWMRKMYMEAQVREFLEKHRNAQQQQQGMLQVLIVAAGYDTLAWRLASEYPTVNFIEIDHPATGKAKWNALQRCLSQRLLLRKDCLCKETRQGEMRNAHESKVLPPNLFFCHKAIGTNCTLKGALVGENIQNANFGGGKLRDSAPTAVVIEGLTFYLTDDENYQMFKELGDLIGQPGSIVAFDFFHLDKFGRPMNSNTQKESSLITSFMKYKVKLFGEPFKWGISPECLADFFRGTGWELVPASRNSFGGSNPNPKHTYATMMGIEYEATVAWKE